MSPFQLYFGLGKDHILDYANGYDHILFVIALCAVYVVSDWKRVLILVTAFTIGHSITLALATLQLIPVNSELVEFLIPVTIFVTAIGNLFRTEAAIREQNIHVNYVFASVFGLIHGMGFSNFLREILGKSDSILTPLLAFNLGLEFGQIIIVGLFMGVSFIAVDLAKVNRRDWKLIISSAIAGIALILIKDSDYLN
ncbi:MAG: HupE/UreJ family protein [Bacteroidota bacterium]